jgi:hypothetical protein
MDEGRRLKKWHDDVSKTKGLARHSRSADWTDETPLKGGIMPKYLCIQRSQPGEKREKPSPAQMQEMYAVFNAWKDKFRQNIVDMGGRLGGGKVVTSEGATDGPFVEAKEVVGGFMIISAASLEEAMQVARECPGVVMPGSSVEVREIHTP